LYGLTQSFGRDHPQSGPVKIIFGQGDDKMSGVPIHSEEFDLLKFSPFQQSVGSGKSGLAPKNCFACDGVVKFGKWRAT
jgi:hypothetical protein